MVKILNPDSMEPNLLVQRVRIQSFTRIFKQKNILYCITNFCSATYYLQRRHLIYISNKLKYLKNEDRYQGE
jgi:hypothetical protein